MSERSVGKEEGTTELVLVRYGELALKKGNRREFELALARNLKDACSRVSPVKVERRWGRMFVHPERRAAEVAKRVQDVFGVSSISPAVRVPLEPDAIAASGEELVRDVLASRPAGEEVTFAVRVRRPNKRFPLRSNELERHVADRVLSNQGGLRVRLRDPELELGIEVRDEGAYLFAERLRGPGGLPVGTVGHALCLLSGGIDSPVAAWYAMKRGCAVSFVTFHSYPYIGDSSKRKLRRLVRALARWQPRNQLIVAPFTEVQEAIRDSAPEAYRTVLYRRFMQRISCRLAEERGAGALLTGDSLGQVASQTMENIACVQDASTLPVLQPLIGFDKQETIEVAQRIGTFDVSIEPEPDCCTVFQPAAPVIRGKIGACRDAEAALDVEGLVERSVAGCEVVDVEW
jgi:thiamine biosynthesis protein ThiI